MTIYGTGIQIRIWNMHIDELNITELTNNTSQLDRRKTTKQNKEKETLALFLSREETTKTFMSIICFFVARRGQQHIFERNKDFHGNHHYKEEMIKPQQISSIDLSILYLQRSIRGSQCRYVYMHAHSSDRNFSQVLFHNCHHCVLSTFLFCPSISTYLLVSLDSRTK